MFRVNFDPPWFQSARDEWVRLKGREHGEDRASAPHSPLLALAFSLQESLWHRPFRVISSFEDKEATGTFMREASR